MTPNTANFVLAYMGLFLGLDASRHLQQPLEIEQFQSRYEYLKTSRQIPAAPQVSRESWQIIRNYYLSKAKLPTTEPDRSVVPRLAQHNFKIDDQAITLLRTLSDGTVAIGGGMKNWLRIVNLSGKVKLERQFSSPPVWIEQDGENYYVLTLGDLLGSLNPKAGSELWLLGKGSETRLVGGLPRSSHFELIKSAEAKTGFIVSAFGGFGNGKLSAFMPRSGSFSELVLSRRDSHVRSKAMFNGDTLRILSLVAGAREQLLLFTVVGDKIRETVLAEYPPQFGSVWLELADLDGDGQDEVLVLGGDNADSGPFNEIKEDQGLYIYSFSGDSLYLKKFISLPGALSMHVIRRDNKVSHIAVARFYAPNESFSDVVVLKHRRGIDFDRTDLRLDARPTVLTSYHITNDTHLLVGSANMPKLELVRGQIRQRDFPGSLLTEVLLP